jgi:hypothetical protein
MAQLSTAPFLGQLAEGVAREVLARGANLPTPTRRRASHDTFTSSHELVYYPVSTG